ncbi:MAG: leucine-rich repeat domain-containing protein, partial [Oscillospiraceae bacterium]|nr:leucine-rich repeat domain-containing protein [Oscillospiraceae bacterium]
MFKKLVSAVTAVSLTVMQVIVPLTASAAALKDDTGSCGTGVSYTLSDTDSNGTYDTLTIDGEGSMQNYADTDAPWYAHGNSIKNVTIGYKVDSIGSNSFAYLTALETIIYPEEVDVENAGIRDDTVQFEYIRIDPEFDPDGDTTQVLIPICIINKIVCSVGKQVVAPQEIQTVEVIYVDEEYRKYIAEEGHDHVVDLEAADPNECQLCGAITNNFKNPLSLSINIPNPLEVESDSEEDIIKALNDDECITFPDELTYGEDYILKISAADDDDYDYIVEIVLAPEYAKKNEIPEGWEKEYFNILIKHYHKFSDEWDHDEWNHWHPCIADGCNITDSDDFKYEDESEYGTHDEEWKHDSEKHWKECTVCGYKMSEEEHDPDIEAPTNDFDQECRICGRILAPKLTHEHDFIGEWQKDETGHWHLCSGCNSEKTELDFKAHTAVSANNAVAATCTEKGMEADTVCFECGYLIKQGNEIPAKGHT